MSEDIKYFKDVEVPMLMTAGVNEKLPKQLVQSIVHSVFLGSRELEAEGKEADYIQVCNITCESPNGAFYQYKWTLRQDDEVTSKEYRKKLLFGQVFNGTVWIIESWNGKTENVTLDDHYITVLLPEEY